MSTTALLKEVRSLRQRAAPTRAPSTAESLALGVLDSLDNWQRQLLTSTSDRILLNISRQAGKSTMAGVLAAHKALSAPGSLSLVLAPSERQAAETFAKCAGFLRGAMPVDSDRKLGVQLANGSRIESLPGSERTIRGFSGVDLLILDEAARVHDALYYAIRPMLAVSGGRLLMMSTPFGKRGVFFAEYQSGTGWERYEVRAEEVPRIPDSFLAEERASLPARIYRQEYECSFEEAEDSVFAYEDVDRAITTDVEPLFGAASV